MSKLEVTLQVTVVTAIFKSFITIDVLNISRTYRNSVSRAYDYKAEVKATVDPSIPDVANKTRI